MGGWWAPLKMVMVMVILHENAFKSWNCVLKFREQITKLTNITIYNCTYSVHIWLGDWLIRTLWFAFITRPLWASVNPHWMVTRSQGQSGNYCLQIFSHTTSSAINTENKMATKGVRHCTKSSCTHYDNNQKPNLVEKALNFLPFHSECVCSMNMYVQLPYWWLSLEYTASSVLMK